MDNKKKWRSLYIGVPILGAIGLSVGIYFLLHQNEDNGGSLGEHTPGRQVPNVPGVQPDVNPDTTLNMEFPDINLINVYNEVRVSNGVPYLSDDFTATIILKIVKESNVIVSDNLKVTVNILAFSKDSLKIQFIFIDGERSASHTYSFSLELDE